MEWQPTINLVIAIAFGCVGWFARTVWDAVQELKTSIHSLEIDVVSNYARRDELKEMRDEINARFDKMEALIGRIFDKLESKQDKQP